MVSKKNVFSIWLLVLFSFCWLPGTGRTELVAHWTFDEAGGSTQVGDAVGGLIGNLSTTGATLVSGGKAGGALSLDKATGGYVTMGDVLRLGTGPYSFVVWVKTSTTDTDTAVLSKHWSGSTSGYFIGMNSNGSYGAANKAWFYNWYNGWEPISSTTVNDNQWHQIVGLRGNGFVKIYVDGLSVESTQTDRGLNDPPDGTPFLLGGYSINGNPLATYTGLVDDIQVYSHMLTDEEVQWLYDHPGQALPCTPPPSGLVSWWGGDNNALDMVGTNNGTLMNGANYAPSIVGQAFSLDNTMNSFVDIPDDPTLHVSTGFSLVTWVNPSVIPVYPNAALVMSKIGPIGNLYGYQMAVSNIGGNNQIWCGFNEAGGSWPHFVATGGNIQTGKWSQIICTYDHNILAVYQDGQLVGSSTPGPVTVAPTTSHLRLGSDDVGQQFYSGLIDGAMVYDRALSSDEIATIYNAGVAGACRPKKSLTISPTGTGSGSVTGNGIACVWNGSSSSGTCSVTLDYNTSVSLTVAPSPGSTFGGWSGGTGSAVGCSGTGACAFSIIQASGVGAPFTLNTYNLAVTPSGTGSGSVTGNGLNCSWNGSSSSGTCSVNLDYNTAVNLTALPSSGSTFNGWSGGSGSAAGCSGTGTCSFSITQASGAGAPLTLNTYNLTVTPSGTGSGSVTGNGLNCTWNGSSTIGTCSVSLAYDIAVSLIAAPDAGSTFSGWSGGSGSAAGCSGTGACSFSITQDSGVGVPFTLNIYNLTVTPSGTGRGSVTGNGIDCEWNGSGSSGTCSLSLDYGTAVSLTAAPNVGSTFTGWNGGTGSAAGCGGTGACAFAFSESSGVEAPFTKVNHIHLPLIVRP